MFNLFLACMMAGFGTYRIYHGEYHWAFLDMFCAVALLTLFAVREITSAINKAD